MLLVVRENEAKTETAAGLLGRALRMWKAGSATPPGRCGPCASGGTSSPGADTQDHRKCREMQVALGFIDPDNQGRAGSESRSNQKRGSQNSRKLVTSESSGEGKWLQLRGAFINTFHDRKWKHTE